jgi:iron complex transport system substrate-binding protein
VRTTLRVLVSAMLCAMLGTVTACSTSPHREASSGSTTAASTEGGTSYPLTLKTPYGTTVLKSKPTRVAIAGEVGDTENVLSLGIVPVLAPKFQLQWPWIDADARAKITQTYQGGADGELPLEKFVTARPDVIIAVTDTKLKQHFDKLSQVAPVVAFPDKPATTQFDWRDSLRLIGAALGRGAEAAKQITTTNDKIDGVKKRHPEFAGKSITFAIDYGPGYGLTFYTGKGSPGEALFHRLGFEPSKHADRFTGERPQVSDEQLALLDSDIVVVNYNTGEAAKKKLESNKLFASVPAVKQGHYLGLLPQGGTSPLAWSIARPTAANLQWSIGYLVPKIATVTKKAS